MMKEKDLHELTYRSLCRPYRPGVVNREKLMQGLRENFSSEELQLFLMFSWTEAPITPEKLAKKAKKEKFSDQSI